MLKSAIIELLSFLQHYSMPGWPSPLLWVGAGASAQAGYPTLNQLKNVLLKDLNDPSSAEDPIESYIRRFSRTDLMNVLENTFGKPTEFAQLHLAIAQLVSADIFSSIITTNYDRLIENALESLNVAYTLQIISQNQELSSRRVPLLIKLHGDRSNWKEAVLDASSYTRFENDEPLVTMQLNLLRRVHSVLFIGCSMQDQRIVNWLQQLSPEERTLLHAGRIVITVKDWEAIPESDRQLFEVCSMQPIFLENHNEIGQLLVEVASRLAPIVESRLTLDIRAHEDQWTISGPTNDAPLHRSTNPLKDSAFVNDLAQLERLSHQPVSVQERLTTEEGAQWAIAKKVGERLSSTLLSDYTREAICTRIKQTGKSRPRLIIQVSDNLDWSKWAMALPWELITLDRDNLPVYRGELEIVREVVVNEAPDLMAPTEQLNVAVCIAAPDVPGNKITLGYEKESYHLARALDQMGLRPAFTELGEMKELIELLEQCKPSVVHFSGNVDGDGLIFENEEGASQIVPAAELSRRLNTKLRPVDRPSHFPSLFFISNCDAKSWFGPKLHATGSADLTERSPDISVAMILHTCGFVEVIDFSGSGFESLRVSTQEAFYSALASGKTTLQSIALARAELCEPFVADDKELKYPLAWAYLRLFHRGPNRPLAVALENRPRELPREFGRRPIEIAGLPVLEFGFIGRRSLQHEIRRKYENGRRLFIIHGLAGIGKTALAIQLIHRTFHSSSSDVLIFRCERLKIETAMVSLKDQAIEHGKHLKLEGWDRIVADIGQRLDEPGEALEELILQLRQFSPELIVYADGIERLLGGPDNLQTKTGEWLPETVGLFDVLNRLSESGILMLLSSRWLWKQHDPDSVVFVDALSPGEMMRMFDSFPELSRLRFEVKERLLPRIDGHPRTVELLDKLIHVRRLNLATPSEELDVWADLILPCLPGTHDRVTADMLLEVLWQLLTDAGRQHAFRLLVARVPLPRPIVRAAGDATDELIRFGLLTRHRIHRLAETGNVWENRWGMHSIVATYVREKVDIQRDTESHLLLGSGYKSFIESKGGSFDDLSEAIYHLHSAQAGDMAWPLTKRFVTELQLRGDFLRALMALEEDERANVSGENLAALLVTRAHIVMEVTNDAAKALDLLVRALTLASSPDIREAVLRARGILLRSLGQLEQSEIDLRHALWLIELTESNESLSYATCLHELGVTLGKRGQLLKAEELLNESLAIKRRTCGEKHHLYASGLHHLGLLAMGFQDYEKAELLLREAVAIKREVLGTFHRSYGHSLTALADTLEKLGRHEEGQSLSTEAHAAQTFMPGLTKGSAMFFAPDISYSDRLRIIALMLSNEGRDEEASKVRDVLKGIGEVVDVPIELRPRPVSESEEIAAAIDEAERHSAAGNRIKAIECLERMAEAAVVSRTCENAAFGGLLCRLGNAYRENQEYEKSESCLREALRVAGKANGPQHPAYAICVASLAETLSYQERHAESYSLYEDALRLLRNSVGHAHHLYIYYLRWYATALSIGMRFGEAEVKWRELVEANEAVHGNGYLQHARDLRELAALLGRQNKLLEAHEIVAKAVDVATKSHGTESEDYVEARWCQTHIGLLMGKPEAVSALPEVLALINKYLRPGNKICEEARWVAVVHGITLTETDEHLSEPQYSDLYSKMMSVGKLMAEHDSLLQSRLKSVANCDDPFEAVKQCQTILAEAEASGEVLAQFSAHDLLSQIFINLGMRQEALNHAAAAREIAERLGIQTIVESAKQRCADVEATISDPKNALGSRLVKLSEMLHRGEFAPAVTLAQELISDAEGFGALDVAASSNGLLSSALEMMGRTEEALSAAQSALSIVNSLDHAKGIEHFRRKVEYLQSLDPVQTKVNTLLYEAQLLRGTHGDQALKTIHLCEEALPLAQSLDNHSNLWSIHRMLAEVFDCLGMKEEAIDEAQESLNLGQLMQSVKLIDEAQNLLNMIMERERSVSDALSARFFRALRSNQPERIAALEEVAMNAEELSAHGIACSAHWVLAHDYEKGNAEAALAHAKASVQLAKELRDEVAIADFSEYLVHLESCNRIESKHSDTESSS